MSTALAVTVFAVAYALIATEKVNRVVVALAGAGLMLALRLVSSEDAFHSTDFGIDWEVIFLLLGMMIVVGVMKQTGLFEIPGHLVGQEGTRPALPDHGRPGRAHRRRLGLPRQRHHRPAGRPGHHPDL